MSFPMLPHNNQDAQGNSGEWIRSDEGNFLETLANSLPSGTTLTANDSIDSIPDIWAKPLLFKMALHGNDQLFGDLHTKVLGEWRAILAMLALKDNRTNLNLRAEHIDLNTDNSAFAKIFKDHAPTRSLNNDPNAWLNDLYIIYYGYKTNPHLPLIEKPLAMTSPLTLVATAADYSNDLAGRISQPWSNDGKTLTDPIPNLTYDELFALREWLGNLHNTLINMQPQNGVLMNDLIGYIQNYSDDITNALANLRAPAQAPIVNIAPSNLGITFGINLGTAEFLRSTTQIAAASSSPFELQINSARSEKQLILLSESIIRNFSNTQQPHQLQITAGLYGNQITDEILKNSLNNRSQIGNIQLHGNFEFRRPEDFFHDKIYILTSGTFNNDGTRRIKGAAGVGKDFILPIKKELLEIFSPDEIVARLFVTAESNISITLNFKFPVKGINGAAQDVVFSKKYLIDPRANNNNRIYINKNSPDIAIYPNMRRPNWKAYYLYYENSEPAGNAPLDQMYYVEPFKYDKHLTPKNLLIEKLTEFPEALIINYLERGNTREIGIVLLPEPPLIEVDANKNWKVGIDFGTSSTMIYFKEMENETDPQALNFQSHLLKIAGSDASTQSNKNFIPFKYPDQPNDGSFLSIFHLHLRNHIINMQPLIDGNILVGVINSETLENLKNIRLNLKWSEEENNAPIAKAYLQQIIFQIFVEAMYNGVASIDWNFSYPTAFSVDQIDNFRTSINNNLRTVYQETGFPNLNQNQNQNQDIASFYTESQAAAFYFGPEGQFGGGAICVDIGAGTTDITVINGAGNQQNPQIIYHTSIKYAGQSMFKQIYKNSNILLPNVNLNNIQIGMKRRQALIDEFMRRAWAQCLQDIVSALATPNAQTVKRVLQCSQLAVAGLFYYLGKILKMLRERQIFTYPNIPPIYLGGNGSRIFDWLTCNDGDINGRHTRIMYQMLQQSSGLNYNNIQILIRKKHPKIAVAYGMINNQQNLDFNQQAINAAIFGADQQEFVYNSVLAGAAFSKNGQDFTDIDFINAEDLHNGISISNLDELQNFITAFNAVPHDELWSDGINFGVVPRHPNNAITFNQTNQLKNNIHNFYTQFINQQPNQISPDPVFIVEMRELMNLITV